VVHASLLTLRAWRDLFGTSNAHRVGVSVGVKIRILALKNSSPFRLEPKPSPDEGGCETLLRGRDVQGLKELQRQGMMIQPNNTLSG
jgi:hypothetical protein